MECWQIWNSCKRERLFYPKNLPKTSLRSGLRRNELYKVWANCRKRGARVFSKLPKPTTFKTLLIHLLQASSAHARYPKGECQICFVQCQQSMVQMTCVLPSWENASMGDIYYHTRMTPTRLTTVNCRRVTSFFVNDTDKTSLMIGWVKTLHRQCKCCINSTSMYIYWRSNSVETYILSWNTRFTALASCPHQVWDGIDLIQRSLIRHSTVDEFMHYQRSWTTG